MFEAFRPDVAVMWDWPILNGRNAAFPILIDGIAAPAIPFDNFDWFESRLADPHSETACASE
jgi:hypothetical protein